MIYYILIHKEIWYVPLSFWSLCHCIVNNIIIVIIVIVVIVIIIVIVIVNFFKIFQLFFAGKFFLTSLFQSKPVALVFPFSISFSVMKT